RRSGCSRTWHNSTCSPSLPGRPRSARCAVAAHVASGTAAADDARRAVSSPGSPFEEHAMKLSIAAVLVTCLLSVAAPATAQDLRLEPVEPEGAGFFAIGGSWLDIDELNDALGSAGYPTFGGGGLTLGGGGYGVHRGRLLLGGEGYAVISGEEAVAGRTVTYGGGYGLFNIGYMIAPTPTTRVYPLFGIGGGGASLRIGARATEDSFGDVLDNPGRTASLNRGSLLLSFGIGAEYRLRRDEHG